MFEPFDVKRSYLSKSLLNTYIACPRRFYIQYIEGYIGSTPELVVGKSFHQQSQEFYDKIDYGRLPGMSESEMVEYFKSLFSIDNERMRQLVENFARFEAKRYRRSPERFKPLFIEKRFVDETNLIEGTIDRIFMGELKPVIVEIKTGNIARYANAVAATRREMATYVYLARLNGIDVSGTTYTYYALHNKVVEWDVEGKVRNIVEIYSRVRERIARGIFDKKVSPGKCNLCPVIERCINE